MNAVVYRFSEERTRIMYALKLLRFLTQLVALFVSQQVYFEEYNDAIYKRNTRPPSLNRFVFLFLSIDATVQLFVLGFLVLLSYVMVDKSEKKSQTFVINDEFIRDFLAEYFVTTTCIAALGTLIGAVVRQKQFFEFDKTGHHGVKMFRMMLIVVCAVIGVVPFFMFF
ncbi:hypothetical protein FOA52_005818 [Chlamydomonas sp. UWO 241]|nr:hypothetical protein FOA52_005818 [Chlamydomonas sp. UWO 241]